MYPRLRDEDETVDRASAEVADDVDMEETEENVRSGEGHDEMAGVGGIDGEGEQERPRVGKGSVSTDSSIAAVVRIQDTQTGTRGQVSCSR